MAVGTGIFTILLIGFCVAAVHIHIPTTAVPKVGTCECAGFANQRHADKDKLAVQIISVNTTCNNLGKKNCIAQCKSVIKKIKKDPEGLCNYFEMVQHVKPVIFARICNEQWFYTGLTSRNYLCCENGKRVLCK